MNESEALLLYAITGRTLSPKTMNNARRVAYADLLKHRLIAEDDGCNPEASRAVTYALDFRRHTRGNGCRRRRSR